MTEQKRTLNSMEGFQRGFKVASDLSGVLGSIKEAPDEHLAFALGTIAALYQGIDDKEQLWRVRKKFWHTEEALGESRNFKIENP